MQEGVYANADAVQPVWEDVVQNIIANRRAIGRERFSEARQPSYSRDSSYGRDPYGPGARNFGGPRRDSQRSDNNSSWNGGGSNTMEPDDSFWDPE